MKYLCIFLIFFYLPGCKSQKVKPLVNPSLNVAELPAQESWNATVFFTDSGLTKAVLDAGHLRVFTEAQETLLDSNIRVKFYNEYEIHTTTLTAKRGKVDDATKNLFAIDSVVAVNDSGVTIITDELIWRNIDQKIVSDRFVTINTPKEKIQGYGFESDQSLQNYVIYNITYITRRDTL
jgi:LPS export ABC transporter protein LptC